MSTPSNTHAHLGMCRMSQILQAGSESSEFLFVPLPIHKIPRPTLHKKLPHKYYPRGSHNLCKELISPHETRHKLSTWILKPCLPSRSWYWRVRLFCVTAKVGAFIYFSHWGSFTAFYQIWFHAWKLLYFDWNFTEFIPKDPMAKCPHWFDIMVNSGPFY